jgi:hypothetical protein
MRSRTGRAGFALTDIAIAIGVMAVLLAAITAATGVIENGRVSTAERSIETLRSASINWLSNGRSNYNGITFDALRTEALLPTGFTETGSNPWGGDYTLTPATDRITISLTNVPQSAGDALGRKFASRAVSVNYDAAGKTFSATF